MQPYRWDIGKIYSVVALSCLLLTASFYWFGFRPLSERLRAEHAHEIRHFLRSGIWLLEGVLSKQRNLARQTASRTAIRKKQIAYLQHLVSRQALVAFSASKLADAMEASRTLVGISRFDPDDNFLFAVGEPLPADVARRCFQGLQPGLHMLGPIQIGRTRRLLFCSPIEDSDAGRVGSDVLVFADSDIHRVIDVPQVGLANFAIVRKGRIVYWPQQLNNAVARQILSTYLTGGRTDPAYILESKPVPGSDWQLYAVVNKARFFADMDRQRVILLAVVFGVTALVLVLAVLVLRPVIRALLREQRLFELSHRDGLTGLYNHSYLQELLEKELARAQRYRRVLSALMFDIDHFKDVNDRYGHQVGDAVLARIGEVVKARLRKADHAARYGGEEFMVLLPETDSHKAVLLAEQLRAVVGREKVRTSVGELSVNISIGVVTYVPSGTAYDRRRFVEQADRAMYASKQGGRNRVTAVVLDATQG
jgi:diguanylate cyclase (GGDEF)-like protein